MVSRNEEKLREKLAAALDECEAWPVLGPDQQGPTPTIFERDEVLAAIMPVIKEFTTPKEQ